jgi:hypothetical protein
VKPMKELVLRVFVACETLSECQAVVRKSHETLQDASNTSDIRQYCLCKAYL